jgi:dTDP-4-dehydrorhamnose 3,5-epimerase
VTSDEGRVLRFQPGEIDGVVVRPLRQFNDARGWLLEYYREDEVPAEFHPVMGYISLTRPGVTRGPHEHRDQADYFVFYTSTFKIYLWDARDGSPTRGRRQVITAGEANPMALIVPPGVVHAYRNTGAVDGVIVNAPNRLYAGQARKEVVDEIRHEEQAGSVYLMD